MKQLTVHGNGFIQVPLADGGRMHVWHPAVPRQVRPTLIHDHRFAFRSTVVRGSLANVVYTIERVMDDGREVAWGVYRPGREDRDEVHDWLYPAGERVRVIQVSAERFGPGEQYDMSEGIFHQTVPVGGPLVTVMHKLREYPDREPRVLVPPTIEPDNDFERGGFAEEFLWALVREALRG